MTHPIHVLPGLTAAARRIALGADLSLGQNEFPYTGALISRTIPAGVSHIRVFMWAGGGGEGVPGGFRNTGAPGHAYGHFAVEEGDVVEIEVGQGGGAAGVNAGASFGGLGGWPDGGEGSRGNATTQGGGGGGGGSSRMWINGVLVLIAGGGAGEDGGSGTDGSGGDGGGSEGDVRSGFSITMTPATQTAAGTTPDATDRSGSGRQGGHGYDSGEDRFTQQGTGAASGGGGGGLFGGAGGELGGTGGGGGSGFAIPLDGGSNSLLDREILEAESLNRTGDPIGFHREGWDSPYGFRKGAVGGENGYDGFIRIDAYGLGDPVQIGRDPTEVSGLNSTLSDSTGSSNIIRLRKYRAPCDMWMTHVGYYHSGNADSNSGGTSNTPARGVVYSARSNDLPAALLARTAQITYDEGSHEIALEAPLFLKAGQVVFVGFHTGAPTTTLTHTTYVLPTGFAASISANYNTTFEQTAETTLERSVSAQTSAYSFWGVGEAEPDKAPDFATAVQPFTTPTSTGLFDVTTTELGGRVPEGVVILGGYAPPNSSAAHIVNSFGCSSRRRLASQYTVSGGIEDNQATTDADSEQRTGFVISIAAPGDTVGTRILGATVDSYITNGVRLNFTDVDIVGRQFVALFFAGEDCICVSQLSIDWTAATQVPLGFHHTFSIFGGEFSNGGNGDGSNAAFGFGVGLLDSAGNQCSLGVKARTGQPAAVVSQAASIVNSEIQVSLTAASIAATLASSAVDSDGFTVTPSTSLSATDTYIFSVFLRGMQARVFDFTTPTSTGVANYTTPGFQPTFALLLGSSLEAWETAAYTDDTASGWGYAAFGANGGVGLSFSYHANSDPTEADSAAGDNVFRIGRTNNPTTISADWDGFTANGFDLDWTAVHSNAVRGLALVVGPA